MLGKFNRVIIGILCVGVLFGSFGCGGGSSSGISPSTLTEGTDGYSGDSTISATVSALQDGLSQVSYEDDGSMGSAAYSALNSQSYSASTTSSNPAGDVANSFRPVTDAVATLFVMNDDGELIDTGLRSRVDDNGQVEFENVRDGLTYVIESEKFGYSRNTAEGAKSLTIQGVVRVEEGDTEVDTQVIPGMDLVIADLAERFEESTLPESLIDDVISLIADTLFDLVSDGLVQLSSEVETVELESEQSITDFELRWFEREEMEEHQ